MNLVTSADKKGQISVWDFEDMEEHTSFEGIHDYQVNSLKFLPARDSMSLLTACCLGRTCLTDIETGMHSKLFDLNPKVWLLLSCILQLTYNSFLYSGHSKQMIDCARAQAIICTLACPEWLSGWCRDGFRVYQMR